MIDDDLVAAVCRELVRRRRPLSADRVREVLGIAGLLDPPPSEPATSTLSKSRALRIALTDLAAREA